MLASYRDVVRYTAVTRADDGAEVAGLLRHVAATLDTWSSAKTASDPRGSQSSLCRGRVQDVYWLCAESASWRFYGWRADRARRSVSPLKQKRLMSRMSRSRGASPRRHASRGLQGHGPENELLRAIHESNPARTTDAIEALGGGPLDEVVDAGAGSFSPAEEAARTAHNIERRRQEGDVRRAADVLRRSLAVASAAERGRVQALPFPGVVVLSVQTESPAQRAAFLARDLLGDGAGHARQAAAAVQELVRLLPSASTDELQLLQRHVAPGEVRELLTAPPRALRVWAAARRAAAEEASGGLRFRELSHELMHAILEANAVDVERVARFVDAPKTARILRSYGDVRNAQLLEKLKLRESLPGHLRRFL